MLRFQQSDGSWKKSILKIYLKDIVVFTRSPAEPIELVRHVWTRLSEAVVFLEMKKCNPFTKTIDYLDHVIRSWRFKIASQKKHGVEGWKDLRNVSGIKRFIALFIVFRRLPRSIPRLSSPPNDAFRVDEPFNFVLDKQELKTKRSLRRKRISPPALAWSYAEGRLALQMPVMYKLRTCYSRRNRVRLRSQSGTGPPRLQGQDGYMKLLNEGASPLYGRFCVFDHIWGGHDLRLEVTKTLSPGYSTCRMRSEDSRPSVYGYPNSTSMSTTAQMKTTKQPTHRRDYVLTAKK